MIKLKRVYEEAEVGDGYRVLVDRLWPRGVSKEEAKVDEWLKEVGPTTELRKWFNHDPERFEEFKRKYITELQANHEVVERLRAIVAQHSTVTLLFAAHDEEHNQAVVIKEFLLR